MVAMSDLNDQNVSSPPLSSSSSSSSHTRLSMSTSSDAMPCSPTSTSSITASFSESASTPSTPSSTPSTTPSASPPSSPPTSHPPTKEGSKKANKLPTKCPLEKCLLCTREQPLCLMRSSTWPAIMRVVFYTLKYNYPEKEFFNLKDDVYSVMLFHWNKLAIHKKGAANWKKHIQDMLSHSKDIFESGLEIYGQNGYWRLKTNTDPWTLSGKTRRVPKKGLAMKRPLDEMPAAEQVPRRPFIPYIAKEQVSKYPENYTPPVNYVFISEQQQQQMSPTNGMVAMAAIAQPPQPTRESPNPFAQRFPPFPNIPQLPPQGPFQASPPYSIAPQLQHQHYLHNSRMAISLPTSRMPSPQRSRSPSPHHTQSLPTSPRNPLLPFSPYSAPASPSNRASPYPIPSRQSPRSQPVSPHGSPPASPRTHRTLRSLRSPPSPQSPRNAHALDESALDSLRTTFEQFHWPNTPGYGGLPHAKMAAQSSSNAQGQSQFGYSHSQQAQQHTQSEPAHHVAFNLFASAKPANPCDVQFLLNE